MRTLALVLLVGCAPPPPSESCFPPFICGAGKAPGYIYVNARWEGVCMPPIVQLGPDHNFIPDAGQGQGPRQ